MNGAPLRSADLDAVLAAGDHTAAPASTGPARKAAALETLIRDELRAQNAVALGLDRNPALSRQIAEKQAAFASWRRQALAAALVEHEIHDAAKSDVDARAYFAEHEVDLRTRTHVRQILTRDRASIETARDAIRAGAPFVEVAASHFPGLPAGVDPPWDLGYLNWAQLPEPWRAIIGKMAVGSTSDVLEGAGGRFWIIEVVDRREDPPMTFEEAEPIVLAALRASKSERNVGEMDQHLRQIAHIELP